MSRRGLLGQSSPCQHTGMERATDPDGARAVRVRAYLGGVRDLKRTFRAPGGADLAAFMKRAALAALPKADGCHLLVVSAERTGEDEPIAAALDRLARRHMLGRDLAAALATTADGARAVLAATAKHAADFGHLRAALAGKEPFSLQVATTEPTAADHATPDADRSVLVPPATPPVGISGSARLHRTLRAVTFLGWRPERKIDAAVAPDDGGRARHGGRRQRGRPHGRPARTPHRRTGGHRRSGGARGP
jgi:hypothetical protein